MIEQVFYLTTRTPAAVLFCQEPSTLLVDRIVFCTKDPQWRARMAKAVLSVVTLVTEENEVDPKHHELAEHVCRFGELCGPGAAAPVYEPEGGWSITPGYVPVSTAPHLWSHSLSLMDTLPLDEDECVELTIRSTADLMDMNAFMIQVPDDGDAN